MGGSFEQTVSLLEVAESILQTSRSLECCLIVRLSCKDLLVVVQGVAGNSGLFQKWRKGYSEADIVRRVSTGDEQLGARAAQVMVCDQITCQFETDLTPSYGSVTLPCAVDRGAVVVDCRLHISLRGSEVR